MTPDAVQTPPQLDNQYETDRVLRSYVRRVLPDEIYAAVEPGLRAMGERAGKELYALQQDDVGAEPSLTRWGAWGDRIDQIELTEVWQRAEEIAAEHGVVATAYEQTHGRHSRVHQMALAYLFIPSTDMYGCPLAMTDGAARTLLDHGRQTLVEKAVPHLTARDPQAFWTSGQWMTEITGGSDVSNTRTSARRDDEGTWRLYGRKWFTSAITANMALALARPAENPDGSDGLGLFYVPIRDEDGPADGIYVNRLKNKLGSRKLPTAELTLDGAIAYPVADEPRHGTRHIAPMLTVTRTWNAVTAASYLRRGLALARDYARRREAFGDAIINHPLHQETLADLQAQLEGMVHLSFRLAELLGGREMEEADANDRALLRLLTPIAKLTTAKQAVAGTSEVLEAFGGAGYVEDTGLPPLLRDAQVLPIWEGTTNVLALDLLRGVKATGGLDPLGTEFERCLTAVEEPQLRQAAREALDAFQSAAEWLRAAQTEGPDALQAGARRFALTLGRALELAYTARHAQWTLTHEQDGRSAAAAERLAAQPIDRITERAADSTDALAREAQGPVLSEKFETSPADAA
ncbi:MAG: acyl-CoA dehydrogenase family protein [Salinibacter sp.]